MSDLSGTIAVVTGASRGIGRGIALALGEAGATVYVTARKMRTTDLVARHTIEETAALVTQRGGRGIAVRCDHANGGDVMALFERVIHVHRHVDLLVNNAWGGHDQLRGPSHSAPFWQQDVDAQWHGMFENGLKGQIVTSRMVAPLMIRRGRGLIVSITAWDRDRYLGSLMHDVAKAAVNRAAVDMARDLQAHDVCSIALSPGAVRTEWAEATGIPNVEQAESVYYAGRAVVELAADSSVMEKNGTVVTVGELAEQYGFTDVDGRRVPPFPFSEVSWEA